MIRFYLETAVYIMCLVLSFYGMSAVNFEKMIKANHVWQAQLLYALLVMALAYLTGSFILSFIYS
ncbi:MAG: DUF1146 domain-containing protein [Solobacterium sp.]|nr:DUF1146 domain-containing protein [Solobacterium sp.]